MLPDILIRRLRDRGSLCLTPWRDGNVQPVSYDVHVGSTGLIQNFDTSVLDLEVDGPTMIKIGIPKRDDSETLVIHPMEFMLVAVDEYLELDYDVAAELDGKSTLGRAGLLVHATAGLIDPGYRGHITCELFNLSRRPIRLWRGMPIGQIVFHRLATEAENPYGSPGLNSHYQHAQEVEGSKPF